MATSAARSASVVTGARVRIGFDDGVRGIATSGWRGRSQSLGIADAVTVLARSGADADAAATMIANAVDLPGHPGRGKLGPGTAIGADVSLSVRPEQIALTRTKTPINVQVKNRIFLGEHSEYLVNSPALGDFLVLVSRQAEAAEGAFAPGEAGYVHWNPETALILIND